MAFLRNREVVIMGYADHINDSTLLVKNPQDGQTEFASFQELIFTPEEEDQYVTPRLPVIQRVETPKIQAKKK